MVLVWIIVYRGLILIRSSGAVQVISGLGILALAYLLSIWFELFAFNWLLEKFFSNLFLIVVILFQAEIRRALAQIGSNPFLKGASQSKDYHVVEEIVKGVHQLAKNRSGALIVLEKLIELDYFVEIGTEVDSACTSELLRAIFHSTSPMHDGAVVIRGGRIHWAGCFLPLSKNPIIDKNLGSRHRAALGLTEETDALVVVVSEEHGRIATVQGGDLKPDLDPQQLRSNIYKFYEVKPRAERADKVADRSDRAGGGGRT